MASAYIGQIAIFGFNFAPRNTAFCNGQILSIAQNTALFSLLGTYYGGNGTSTFALPNLQGRIPTHQGQSPGGSQYFIGEMDGTESVTLTSSQIPAHSHGTTLNAVNANGNLKTPANDLPAGVQGTNTNVYSNAAPNASNTGMLAAVGGNQSHPNMQPYLVLNYCIALQGIFPARN